MDTLLLDRSSWDLVVDSAGNIAMAGVPYSQAQDAASAIKTFQGEAFYDTTLGVPYWQQILSYRPPLSLIKAKLVAAALTVPGVVAARAFVTSLANRTVAGQVQIKNEAGQTSLANF